MPKRAADSAASPREERARAALAEITLPEHVGALLGEETVDGVVTLRFATLQSGYPGWRWTVSLAELEPGAPSVLETELIPGDGALLAPDWVPWSERLEEYRAAQAAAGLGDEAGLDGDDDDEDPDEDDELDVDYDGPDPEDVVIDEGDEADGPGSGLAAAAPDAPAVDVDGDEEDDADAEAGDGDGEPRRPRRRRRSRRRRQDDRGDSEE